MSGNRALAYEGIMGKIIRWTVLSLLMGGLTGTASAVFLAGLDRLTDTRLEHPWLLWLLPPGGALVSLMYKKYGASAGKGNNLIVEQIRRDDEAAGTFEPVPAIMAPFVLLGTWATHLFGGSAGREGTAVQMGGSLGDVLGRLVRSEGGERRMLLIAGISGGFASVFGTPLAGAVFALEVVTMGRWVALRMVVPSAIAAFTGDYVTRAWGIHHLHYAWGGIPAFSLFVMLKVLTAALAFGLMSLLFTLGVQYVKQGMGAIVAHAGWRSFIGGFVVIGLVYAAGTRDYLGLSLPLLQRAFDEPLSSFAFLWKTIFTVVTLGSGYMGGEVTPLFVIGGTLGNALSPLLQLGVPFLAGLGLLGVFSGAANAPAACFCLGLELFGFHGAGYMAVVCLVSFMFSGHAGIYGAQLAGVERPRYFVRVPGLTPIRSRRRKQRRE